MTVENCENSPTVASRGFGGKARPLLEIAGVIWIAGRGSGGKARPPLEIAGLVWVAGRGFGGKARPPLEIAGLVWVAGRGFDGKARTPLEIADFVQASSGGVRMVVWHDRLSVCGRQLTAGRALGQDRVRHLGLYCLGRFRDMRCLLCVDKCAKVSVCEVRI